MKTFSGLILVLAFLFPGETTYGFHGGGKNVKVIKHGDTSSRSWLGVSVRDLTEERARELALKEAEGAYVGEVVKNSPADSAGIMEGDIIVEFDGRHIYDADGLVSAVRKTDVGVKVNLKVVRNGKRKELQATIGKPGRRMSFSFTPPDVPGHVRIFRGPRLGMTLIPLNPQLGKYFEAPDGKGLLVEKVEEGSAAEKAGFKAGDVVTKVGTKPVERIHEFRSGLAEHGEGEKVEVEIIRKGSPRTLSVEIGKIQEEGFDFSIGDVDVPDFDVEIPEIEDLRHFEFNLEELRPELERLQRELDRLKERIGERLQQRIIRDKNRVVEM